MKFDLKYSTLIPNPKFGYEIYEGDIDYINAYISVIQDLFLEDKSINFCLYCLGEDWNTKIFYDFSLFTEHLSEIHRVCKSNNGYTYLMWYYEQGIDREIKFTKLSNQIIRIENVSGDKWISPLQFEDIKIDDLKNQIHNFVNKIKEAVEIIYPELNQLEMLQQWYKSFEV